MSQLCRAFLFSMVFIFSFRVFAVEVSCPNEVVEFGRKLKTGLAAQFGDIKKCANKYGEISAAEMQSYDDKSCVNYTGTLRPGLRVYPIAETFFFQDLAERSRKHAVCKIQAFTKYTTDAETRKKLDTAAQEAFQIYKNEIADMAEYRAGVLNECAQYLKYKEAPGPMVGPEKECLDRFDEVNREMTSTLTRISMGHEPEVANALIEMAKKGQFDIGAYQNSVYAASDKYVQSQKYYLQKSVPTGKDQIQYCIGEEYRSQAVTTGQADHLLDALPLDKKFKAKMKCRLDAKYISGPEKLEKAGSIAFAASMLLGTGLWIKGVQITGGAAFASYAANSLINATVVMNVVDDLHKSCYPAAHTISSHESCDVEQDLKMAVIAKDQSKCAKDWGSAGLVATGALGKFMMGRRAARQAAAQPEPAVNKAPSGYAGSVTKQEFTVAEKLQMARDNLKLKKQNLMALRKNIEKYDDKPAMREFFENQVKDFKDDIRKAEQELSDLEKSLKPSQP